MALLYLKIAFKYKIIIILNKLKGGITMDIASLSMAMSSAKIGNEFGTAMLSKSLDSREAEGAGIVQMIDAAAMERSVTPHIGGNFDMSV